MTNDSIRDAVSGDDADPSASENSKKPYEAPKILSVEPLEAVAANCDPPSGGFGKTVPFPCGALGS